MKNKLALTVIIFLLATSVNATTWFPSTHKCPVCHKKNTFQTWGSYGSYIYHWPSKFQLIFWPLIDDESVYCCSKCHFTAIMWDFDSIPQNKIKQLKDFLSTIKLEKTKDYQQIPMSTRLDIAEGVYKILVRNQDFWCRFYRVKGYHYAREKKYDQAKSSRLEAMIIARAMLIDTLYKGLEKQKLYIIAAMHYYTGNKDSAMAYLNRAEKHTFFELNNENSESYNEYLSELIVQYKEMILKSKDEEE